MLHRTLRSDPTNESVFLKPWNQVSTSCPIIVQELFGLTIIVKIPSRFPFSSPPLPLSNEMILYNVFDIVMERVSFFFYLLNYVESYCCSNQYIQEMGSKKASFIVRVQFPAVRTINSGDIFLYFSFF